MLPDFGKALQRLVSEGVDVLILRFADPLEAFSHALIVPVLAVERVLALVPAELGILLFGLAAFAASRNATFAGAMTFLAAGLGLLGLWPAAMQSLALIIVGIVLVGLIGLPLGIAAARWRPLSNAIAPVYDVMQTVPSFVYLIPVAMLLGLGRAPALIATVIYALPPLARLTELGLREVDQQLVESGRALGLTRRQSLWLVELPLARPAILQGLNQSIMMALGMVVIASMIGAKGLGEIVLLGLQRADPGLGFVGGLGIVFLAILIDRLTQAALGTRREKVGGAGR